MKSTAGGSVFTTLKMLCLSCAATYWHNTAIRLHALERLLEGMQVLNANILVRRKILNKLSFTPARKKSKLFVLNYEAESA